MSNTLGRSYPLTVTLPPEILAAVRAVGQATQELVHAAWTESTFVSLEASTTSQAYKWAEQARPCAFPAPIPGAGRWPSRVQRAAWEGAGRILRSHGERRAIYGGIRDAVLCSWYALSDAPLDTIVVNAQTALPDVSTVVIRNVAEQAFAVLESGTFLPGAYTEFQEAPDLRTALMTAAADDGATRGQLVRYAREGDAFVFRCKGLTATGWAWSPEQRVLLPDVIRRAMAAGWVLAAPSIRVQPDGTCFLDITLKKDRPRLLPRVIPRESRVLGLDWNIKHLLVLQAVQGDQRLGQPVFLHVRGALAQLHGMRTMTRLTQRALSFGRQALLICVQQGWLPLALLLARRLEQRTQERKDLWEHYRHLQEQLAHMAANLVLEQALALGCGTIAAEDLRSLRSQHLGRRLNWAINSQIRAKVWAQIQRRAEEQGIRTVTVFPRGTSHSCPQCRQLGIRTKSTHDRAHVAGGAWFHCRGCSYNAASDYVAATNIAILGCYGTRETRIGRVPVVRAVHQVTPARPALARPAPIAPELRDNVVSSYTAGTPMLPFPSDVSVKVRTHPQGCARKTFGFPHRVRVSMCPSPGTQALAA